MTIKFLQPEWPAPANIKAFTTVRDSWGNLNLRPKDPQSKLLLRELLQLPDDPIWITQTHSDIALEALPENKDKIADASFATQPNHVCVVLTADCLPVLICNKQGTRVAAIHAGWRGLAQGIIEMTLEAMKISSQDLLVWLGPAIGPKKFEVGKDVYDAFTSKDADAVHAFAAHEENKWHADLYALAKYRLKQQGISQIYGGDFCTYTQEELFYSYRRDKAETGRMASVIWIATGQG